MRRLLLPFLIVVLGAEVSACAKAADGDDNNGTGTDGGTPGKDGAAPGKDGSSGMDGTTGFDSGPGCDKCGGATCLDLKNDTNNCGSCGNVCADKCCNGACIDTTNDNSNCGACGTACMNGNQCCSASCVDTQTDLQNCGACGASCNGTCIAGKCKTTCTVDLGSCAHSPCVTGVALNDMCDPDACTFLICDFIDPNCCSSTWNSTCVQEAVVWCGENCQGC